MTAPIAPFLDIDLPLPDRRDGKVRVSYELPPGNDGERRRLFVTRFVRMLRGGENKQKSGLAQSMWESPLFFGRSDEGMGRVVTVWAVFVLLLNTLLQTTIAVIVLLNMGDPTFVARIIEDLWCASEPRFAAA